MKYMAQGGPKVTNALATAPGTPQTFHPINLIIKIKSGPGIAGASAKKLVNSRSVIQSWVKTTKLRTSGRMLEKPPKLIDDMARCAVRAIGARRSLIGSPLLQIQRGQC